MGIYRYPKKRK